MKSIILILSLVGSIASADWVVPPTGIVDYSGNAPTQLPTFNIPRPTTINYPLPEWSNQQIQPVDSYPVYNYQSTWNGGE